MARKGAEEPTTILPPFVWCGPRPCLEMSDCPDGTICRMEPNIGDPSYACLPVLPDAVEIDEASPDVTDTLLDGAEGTDACVPHCGCLGDDTRQD